MARIQGYEWIGEVKEVNLKKTYSPILQLLLRCRDLLPRQPSPPGQSSPGGMKHSEIIAITHARHPSQEASATEIRRRDVLRFGDATQETVVDMHDEENTACEENRRDQIPWLFKLSPISCVEDRVPVCIFFRRRGG